MSIDTATAKEIWSAQNAYYARLDAPMPTGDKMREEYDFDSETSDERYARVRKDNSAINRQVAGAHYKHFVIQPVEFCYKNDIPYMEATAIKYLCRWREKGGIQDLEKAKHFIEMLMEFENANDS